MFILNKPSFTQRLFTRNRFLAQDSAAKSIFVRIREVSQSAGQAFHRNVYPALGLSLLFTGYFFFQIHRLIVDEDRLDHSDRAIGQAVLLQKLMLDAETGIRGFLLTGADVTLNPFREQNVVFGKALESAKGSVSDNPEQTLQLQSVETQFGIWVTRARELVIQPEGKRLGPADEQIAAANLREAKAYFGLGEGRLVMDRCRTAINTFLTNEQKLRDQRAITLRREIPRAIASGAAATLVLRVIGVLILHRIRRSKNQNADQNPLGNPA